MDSPNFYVCFHKEERCHFRLSLIPLTWQFRCQRLSFIGTSLLEFTGKKQQLCENAWLTLYEDWPPSHSISMTAHILDGWWKQCQLNSSNLIESARTKVGKINKLINQHAIRRIAWEEEGDETRQGDSKSRTPEPPLSHDLMQLHFLLMMDMSINRMLDDTVWVTIFRKAYRTTCKTWTCNAKNISTIGELSIYKAIICLKISHCNFPYQNGSCGVKCASNLCLQMHEKYFKND